MCNIVHDNGAVGIPVVHRRERFVALLAGRIPYLKFDRGMVVQGDCLRQKSGPDGRFSIVVKLILGSQSAGWMSKGARDWS